MSDSDSVEWIRLTFPRFVPPGFMDSLYGIVEGEVQPDGSVEVRGHTLTPTGDVNLDPGREMAIRRSGGDVYAYPLDVYEREQEQEQERRERRKRQKERARERYQDWKARRAREFWNQYDIPFRHDVAIKGRRSGLTRGSWGDGRAENTVEHLYVKEGFTSGPTQYWLEREPDTYLCRMGAEFRFDEGETVRDSDGGVVLKPVTCQSCLDLMERWRVEDGDDDE